MESVQLTTYIGYNGTIVSTIDYIYRLDINNMAHEITNLYINAANKVNQIDSLNPKYKKTKKQGRSKNKTWYTNECKTMKRQLNSISKSLHRTPND